MAKTFAGILIGKAIDEGKLNLQDKVSKFLLNTKPEATIEDVLRMSSGIAFKEEYSGIPVDSDATQMLYLKGPRTGFGNYSASLPVRSNKPGSYFYYSSGDTNILMEILKKISPSQEEYNAYPWKKLFGPAGIQSATFEQDATGTFAGSSYVYLTAEDYLKIGRLLMNEGKNGHTQVIPTGYFSMMKTLAPGVNTEALEGTSQTRAYSSQLTTNLPISGRGLGSEYLDLPEDALILIGHQGQLVVRSPSQKLVIVRLATDKGTSFNRKGFFAAVRKLVLEKELGYETVRDVAVTQKLELPVAPNLHSVKAAKKEKTAFGDYFKVPHLIRAMAAKEYCSCRNIVGRSDQSCRADLKVSLPILPKLKMNANGDVKAILGAGVFGKVSKARFNGPELGCSLVQTK